MWQGSRLKRGHRHGNGLVVYAVYVLRYPPSISYLVCFQSHRKKCNGFVACISHFLPTPPFPTSQPPAPHPPLTARIDISWTMWRAGFWKWIGDPCCHTRAIIRRGFYRSRSVWTWSTPSRRVGGKLFFFNSELVFEFPVYTSRISIFSR